MAEEYVLRYFPNSICPEGFGKKGRKGIGSVTLERLEEVAEILENERMFHSREELGDITRYSFKKGDEINCGELEGDDDLFTLSADVYIEVGKMKDVPYSSVEPVTGHKKMGLREARAMSYLKSSSLPSLVNTAVFRLGLPVDPELIDITN